MTCASFPLPPHVEIETLKYHVLSIVEDSSAAHLRQHTDQNGEFTISYERPLHFLSLAGRSLFSGSGIDGAGVRCKTIIAQDHRSLRPDRL
jgi:hypothetical protein